jgi:NADH/NAD ratio-sensing transcriptional regulator Rex
MNIESGIPIPSISVAKSELGRKVRAMEVGQSVLCDSEEESQRVRDAMRSAGFKCSRRKVDGGFRVWRVA